MSSVGICTPLKVEDPYNQIHHHRHPHHPHPHRHPDHHHHYHHHRHHQCYHYRKSPHSEPDLPETNGSEPSKTGLHTHLLKISPNIPVTNVSASVEVPAMTTTPNCEAVTDDDHSMESESLDDDDEEEEEPICSTPLRLTQLNVLHFYGLVYKALSNLSGQFPPTNQNTPVENSSPRTGLNVPIYSTSAQTTQTTLDPDQVTVNTDPASPNLLHQLLIGVDVAQVRTRSQLSNLTATATGCAKFTVPEQSPQPGTNSSPPNCLTSLLSTITSTTTTTASTTTPVVFNCPKPVDLNFSEFMNQTDCNLNLPFKPSCPNQDLSHSAAMTGTQYQRRNRHRSFSKYLSKDSIHSTVPGQVVAQPASSSCRPRSYSDLNVGSSGSSSISSSSSAPNSYRGRRFQPIRQHLHTNRIHRLDSNPTDSKPDSTTPDLSDSPSLLAQLVSKPDHHHHHQYSQSSNSENYSPSTEPHSSDSDQHNLFPLPLCSRLSTSAQHPQQLIFQWLQKADYFVTSHCPTIPPGTLLQDCLQSHPIPCCPGLVTRRLWLQLLLVQMIESRFKLSLDIHPELSRINLDPDSSSSSSTTTIKLDLSEQTLARIMGSLSAEDRKLAVLGDFVFLSKLHNFLDEQIRIERSPTEFDQIRLCILSQSTYPYHYSKSYATTLEEIHSKNQSGPKFVQTLQLLNYLHCFEPEELKHFFQLDSNYGHFST